MRIIGFEESPKGASTYMTCLAERCTPLLHAGITVQGWTQPSLRSFLDYLDTVGVRSLDMWTSNMSPDDMDTVSPHTSPLQHCIRCCCRSGAQCSWFVPELKRWVKK